MGIDIVVDPTPTPTPAPAPTCAGQSGDLNSDGVINVLDVQGVVAIISGGEFPDPCADLNGDGLVNISDNILLINIIIG